MITEDPQLEMRLRHYGSTVRQEARVSPELHARIIARVGHHAPARPYRMLVQLAAARQPLANATSTRPCLSTDMSLKSSMLRQGFEPPPFQMQPTCTGSLGVASTVVQVRPPS